MNLSLNPGILANMLCNCLLQSIEIFSKHRICTMQSNKYINFTYTRNINYMHKVTVDM